MKTKKRKKEIIIITLEFKIIDYYGSINILWKTKQIESKCSMDHRKEIKLVEIFNKLWGDQYHIMAWKQVYFGQLSLLILFEI